MKIKQREMAKSTDDMKHQVGQVAVEVKHLDSNQVYTAWLSGYTYLGRGVHENSDDFAEITTLTTSPQCIQFCEQKRANSGTAWNGVGGMWLMDVVSVGGTTLDYSEWMHLRHL